MEWLYLGIAIAFELAGTVCLKLSHGFERLAPTLAILPLYAVSFTFLTLAVKVIPIGTAYAVWSGVGTALIAVIGFAAFREPMTALRLVCLGLIIVGVVGLHMAGRGAAGT